MKTKLFITGFLLSLFFVTCDDSLDTIGMGIQPGEDKIDVFDAIVNAHGETIELESIYAKTVAGYLGKIYDSSYGTIKSGYICQFYPTEGFELDSLPKDEKYHKVDSVRLNVFFNNFLGDSLAPMGATVYPVVKPLKSDYYTNQKPADYCDLNTAWGQAAYAIRDMRLTDSISYNDPYRRITIPLPNEFGTKLFEEYKKENHGNWASLEKFTEFFPGVFIESSFGIGSMAAVDYTEIYVYYTREYKNQNWNGTADTLMMDAAILSVTKEIIQLNTFENSADKELLEPNNDKMYIKSPTGIVSKITIPISEVVENIGTKKFNNASLSIKAYPADQSKYAFTMPGLGEKRNKTKSKLLLIEPDSLDTFIKEQRIADSKTSYVTTFNEKTYSYDFGNISNVIQNAIDNDSEKDLELILVPVVTEFYEASSGYSSTVEVDYKTMHDLHPSAVTLMKGDENIQIRVIVSDLETNSK